MVNIVALRQLVELLLLQAAEKDTTPEGETEFIRGLRDGEATGLRRAAERLSQLIAQEPPCPTK